jgi:ribose transport system permease protein
MPVLLFFLAALLFAVFLGRTNLGRFAYAMGDNPQGAKIAGIAVRPATVLIYVFSAVTAFFAGLVMAAVLHTVALRVYNSTLIYDVILVVVLGGIGLSGGRGGVTNVLVGTLLIGILTNILTLLNADVVIQDAVKGGLLLVAIIVDSRLNPRNEETAQQGDI